MSKEELIKEVLNMRKFNYALTPDEVFLEILKAINAEPIIRCRDCKWYAETEDEEMNIYPTCEHPEEGGGWTSGKDWFCADGERRRDECTD